MERCKRSGNTVSPYTGGKQKTRIQEGQLREEVAKERFWRLRPDGIAILPPWGIRPESSAFSFITGARSVNKQDLRKNLKFFKVSETNIQSLYSKN
jgi:hypothetical protein